MREIKQLKKSKQYSRIDDQRLFTNENRKRIFTAINEKPGISYSKLHSNLDVSKPTLSYHLSVLENFGLINKIKIQSSAKFFDASIEDIDSKMLLSEKQRLILEYVYDNGKVTQKDIVESTDMSQPTVSRAVNSLSEKGLLLLKYNNKRMKILPGDA